MGTKCKKQKVYSKVFCATFFAFHIPFFAFCISQHFAPGSAFTWKVKGFHGLLFAALIKLETHMKCEKYIGSVSYFVVWFTKTFVKYPRNAKYEKCIAAIKPAIHLSPIKMLAKQEKREMYRWHFINHLANHFPHLVFRHSRQVIGIFTKCQRGWHDNFLVKFVAESKMNKISDIVRSV